MQVSKSWYDSSYTRRTFLSISWLALFLSNFITWIIIISKYWDLVFGGNFHLYNLTYRTLLTFPIIFIVYGMLLFALYTNSFIRYLNLFLGIEHKIQSDSSPESQDMFIDFEVGQFKKLISRFKAFFLIEILTWVLTLFILLLPIIPIR